MVGGANFDLVAKNEDGPANPSPAGLLALAEPVWLFGAGPDTGRGGGFRSPAEKNLSSGLLSGALSRELELAARNSDILGLDSGSSSGSPRPERFVSEDAERATGQIGRAHV